jgi:hypothetical protein
MMGDSAAKAAGCVGGNVLRIKPRPGDYVIAALLLLVALASPVLTAQSATANLTAIITQDGQELSRIRLTGLADPIEVSYGGAYPGVILAESGRIRFLETQCPDHICVRTGWLTRAGSTAACLPARVLIRLDGSEAGDVDVSIQ